MDSEYSDDDCYICYDIMSDPSKLPCGHYMCLNCLENVLQFKRTCPMCRADAPVSFKPRIDKERQEKIQETQKIAASAYLKQLKLDKVFCDTLTLTYGNTHKLVNRASPIWSAFVRIADNKLDTSHFIKKVTFTIHPTFKNPVIEVIEAPFRVARNGQETFPVNIVVHWKEWLKKSPTELRHDLCFSGSGKSMTYAVKFDKSIFEEGNEENDEGEEEEGSEEDEDITFEYSDSSWPTPKALDLHYGDKLALVESKNSTKYKWTVFVKLNDDGLDASKYIQKVVFRFDPPIPSPKREIKTVPFQFDCVGLTRYKIIMVVHWRPWLEKNPTVLNHELSFSGAGSSKTEPVYFKSIFLKPKKKFAFSSWLPSKKIGI